MMVIVHVTTLIVLMAAAYGAGLVTPWLWRWRRKAHH
jgi:hypothetical protein